MFLLLLLAVGCLFTQTLLGVTIEQLLSKRIFMAIALWYETNENVTNCISTSPTDEKTRMNNEWNVCRFVECNTFTVSHYHDSLNIVGGTLSISPLIWSTFQIRSSLFEIPIDIAESLEHVTLFCFFFLTGFRFVCVLFVDCDEMTK